MYASIFKNDIDVYQSKRTTMSGEILPSAITSTKMKSRNWSLMMRDLKGVQRFQDWDTAIRPMQEQSRSLPGLRLHWISSVSARPVFLCVTARRFEPLQHAPKLTKLYTKVTQGQNCSILKKRHGTKARWFGPEASDFHLTCSTSQGSEGVGRGRGWCRRAQSH